MDYLSTTALSTAFVGSFYIWPKEAKFFLTGVRDLPRAATQDDIYVDRDSPASILRRTISLTGIGILSGVYLWGLRSRSVPPSAFPHEPGVGSSVLRDGATDVVRSALSIAALFAGHIVERGWSLLHSLPRTKEEAFQFARDIILCPVGEETFFRGVLFHVLRRRSALVRILASTVAFALCHVHHVVSAAADEYRYGPSSTTSEEEDETTRTHPQEAHEDKRKRDAWRAAWKHVCKLLVITSLFGCVSGYYYTFVCHENLCAITVVHAMCNFLGPPRFRCFGRQSSKNMSPVKRLELCSLYVLGIALWWKCL